MTEQDWKLLLIFAFFPISLLIGLIYLIVTMTQVLMNPNQKVIQKLAPVKKIPVVPYNPRIAQVQYPISRQKLHHKRRGPITFSVDQNGLKPKVMKRSRSKPDEFRRQAIRNSFRLIKGKN
jgi:hypothetical protein